MTRRNRPRRHFHRSGSCPSEGFHDAWPSGPSYDPTSDLRKTLQPAVGMDNHGLADPLQEGAVTPIIRIRDRIVHHNSVLLRPLFGPVPFSVPITGRARADPDEPTTLDQDGRRQRIG